MVYTGSGRMGLWIRFFLLFGFVDLSRILMPEKDRDPKASRCHGLVVWLVDCRISRLVHWVCLCYPFSGFDGRRFGVGGLICWCHLWGLLLVLVLMSWLF